MARKKQEPKEVKPEVKQEPKAKKEPKTVADKIEQVCKDAFLEKDKPSRQYIKKAMAEKYDYTNEALIKKTLGLMVKSGKLIQEGQTFYAKGFKPEPEPEEWKPLPPDEKHCPTQDNSDNFPNHPHYEYAIENSDERSFYKFLFNMYQLEELYRQTGDEDRAEAFNTAWSNMLDCSDHNYEEKDKYGNYIGIGHEDMGSNMEANDVKCLRDIHGVGASTVKLIEEWIETGKLQRLEDLKEKCSTSVLKEDDKEEFEAKKDYMPGFLNNLGELAELYEEEDDFRATSFRRAIIALEGQIITSVEDIKLFNLIELKGVGKSTLMMLEEFITSGKIEKLEEKKHPKLGRVSKEEWDTFIDTHEPLRQYLHEKEFVVGNFPEDELEKLKYGEYTVWITCVYHERCLKDELERMLGYDEDLSYDMSELKRRIDKYEFSDMANHEQYIFEGYLVKEGTDIKTHPFSFSMSGEHRHNVEALGNYGWTPPGLTAYLHEELNLQGGWEDKVVKRDAPNANPDQVEWFATLTEEQAGYIQDWWDSEGEKKCGEENGAFGSRGIPFTFEYEGDTYKVDGDAEEDEWEGSVRGISFDGYICKNGVDHGTFSCKIEFDGFDTGEGYQRCGIGEDEEDDDEDLAEACRDAFDDAYILQGSRAYRE